MVAIYSTVRLSSLKYPKIGLSNRDLQRLELTHIELKLGAIADQVIER